ncbi:MAG: hypothetical protein JXA23_12365, partial [Bacteroidales bacterium]|nr:hypothetical protein [Bacteroidales bacterium]
MKQIIGSFFRQLLFWILFFNLTRFSFILYYLHLLQIEQIPFQEVILLPYHAFKLDLATACYFMAFPFLILVVQSVYSPRWINTINKVYAGILIVLYSITAVGEMGLYSEWKTKINYKVIKYLSHPGEIYNSVGTIDFLVLVLILVVMIVVGMFSYIRWFYPVL